jgi:hypothetical protein
MSSMTRTLLLASAALLSLPATALAQTAPVARAPVTPTTAPAPDAYEWDRARAALLARPASYGMQQQVQRWQ